MRRTRRIRIGERYFTIAEIAEEAKLTQAGVWARIRAGVEGDALFLPQKPRAVIEAEAKMRQRLREAVRTKYKRTCPNCGCAFDIFQPAHMLKHIKPGL
jgi:hypothetical protein